MRIITIHCGFLVADMYECKRYGLSQSAYSITQLILSHGDIYMENYVIGREYFLRSSVTGNGRKLHEYKYVGR